MLARRRSRRCLRRSALKPRTGACARANARGSDGRDDIEGAPDAPSFGVVCPRRVFLLDVIAQVCPLALRLPFVLALVPVNTRELRAGGCSVLNKIDSVLEVFAVCARRILLRRVISQVYPFATCRPFVLLLCQMTPLN